MGATVQIMQAVCAVVWGVEALLLTPGAWRLWNRRGDALDAGRVPILIFSLVQVGFSVRWFVWPDAMGVMGSAETAFWATLYLASAGAGLFCIFAHAPVNRNLR